MTNPVIAIGLDSADPFHLEHYIHGGHLPTLARLRQHGSYRYLDDFDLFTAETPWTTFSTGCAPTTTGYWSPLGFDAKNYKMRTLAAYDYAEFEPFYALGKNYRVAAFDVPQVRFTDQINGIQVAAWGAHSPQVESASVPEKLFKEITDKHGEHPGLHLDYAECLNQGTVRAVQRMLEVGIERRGRVCVDLLKRERWDLFVTVFGETHGAGHNFLHVSDPRHPLYPSMHDDYGDDPLLSCYRKIDKAIGDMLEAAPGSDVVIFSAHGMGPNTMDLPSNVFLPELMYRYSFPGRKQLGANSSIDRPVPPLVTECVRDNWVWEMWTSRHDSNRLRRELKRKLPWGAFKHIEKYLGSVDPEENMVSPFALEESDGSLYWAPARWYEPMWTRMTAFALPSFSEGYVRINVAGREPHGVVAPKDYISVRDEIVALVQDMEDARHGIPMVRKTWTTRDNPFEEGNLPDADIVFGWQDRFAADVVDHPLFGRIGPVPFQRAGSHRPLGFMLAAGPGVPNEIKPPRGHALDIAPTILSLMEARIPQRLEGKALIEPMRAIIA